MANIDEKDSEINQLKTALERLEFLVKEKEEDKIQLNNEVIKKDTKLIQTLTDNDDLKSQKQKLELEFQEIKEKLEKNQSINSDDEKQKNIDALKAQVDKLKASLSTLKEDYDYLVEEKKVYKFLCLTKKKTGFGRD